MLNLTNAKDHRDAVRRQEHERLDPGEPHPASTATRQGIWRDARCTVPRAPKGSRSPSPTAQAATVMALAAWTILK